MRASAAGTYRFNVQQHTVGIFDFRVRKPATSATNQGVSKTLTLTVRQPFSVTAKAAATVKKARSSPSPARSLRGSAPPADAA